jgi:hypothetical protein
MVNGTVVVVVAGRVDGVRDVADECVEVCDVPHAVTIATNTNHAPTVGRRCLRTLLRCKTIARAVLTTPS